MEQHHHHLFTPAFFFTSPTPTLLHALEAAFPSELARLKNAYSIRDPTTITTTSQTPSPSQILYGANHDEVNRTLVSILALRWVYTDDYDAFSGVVAVHSEDVGITRSSFAWIRTHLLSVLSSHDDDDDDNNNHVHNNNLAALVTALVINDLGKDPSLALDYHTLTGTSIASLNHDAILLKAATTQQAPMIPSLARLPSRCRADIVRGLSLGAVFNYGQLAQAENAPACLATLRQFNTERDRRAIDLHFVEQLLDVAGAAGHMDWTCARKLTEPIVQAYRVGHDVVMAQVTSNNSLGLRDGYELVLIHRASLLQNKGGGFLDVKVANDRALLRLLCMGGVSNSTTAHLFQSAWDSLDEPIRQVLVRTLNADGTVEEPVVQPTYMPALLTQAADASNPSRSGEDKERALRSALVYLSRVMTLLPGEAGGQVIVVERNVLDVVKNIVQSQGFRKDPSILETAEVPPGVVAVVDERT